MKIKSGAIVALGFAVCIVLISCSPTSTRSVKPSDSATSAETQPSIDPISPLPPGSGDRPLQPGQSGTEYTPDGLPALTPEKTVSADQLFAEKLSNDGERFKRLENAVADLRRQFDAVKPAIIRLTAVEADMEQLVTQLQTLTPGAIPPPPKHGANVSDTTNIPDIGPMADSSTGDLLDNEPAKIPAKKAATKTPEKDTKKPDPVGAIAPQSLTEIKAASVAPVSVPAVPVTPVKAEAAPVPISAPAKEYVSGDIARVQPTPPRSFTWRNFQNDAQKSEAAEKDIATKALTVEKAPAIAQTPKAAPVAVAIEPIAQATTPVAPVAIAIPATPVVAPAPVKQASVPGQVSVKAVRIADHGASTRIVIDASEKTPFAYNIDNSEHLLLIELPNVAWTGAQSGTAMSPLAGSWTVSDDGKTVVLAVSLKNKAAMASSTALPASGDTPYRIVFDLKPSS